MEDVTSQLAELQKAIQNIEASLNDNNIRSAGHFGPMPAAEETGKIEAGRGGISGEAAHIVCCSRIPSGAFPVG